MTAYFIKRRRPKSPVYVAVHPTAYPEADPQHDLVRCHYTGALIPLRESIVLGAIIPQASTSFACHPLAGGAMRRSKRQFDEAEQNCNTCKYLERLPFDRAGRDYRLSGLMPGRCHNPDRKPVYSAGDDMIQFCPDDCMLQPCHEQRA